MLEAGVPQKQLGPAALTHGSRMGPWGPRRPMGEKGVKGNHGVPAPGPTETHLGSGVGGLPSSPAEF